MKGKANLDLLNLEDMELEDLAMDAEAVGEGIDYAGQKGAQIYKVIKQLRPIADDMWRSYDPKSHGDYSEKAWGGFDTAKDIGKSLGGWKGVQKAGKAISGKTEEQPQAEV
eukprot:CAMPEP_0168608602 /NCGR_PEP_ID=MMETSP0449_2-20121227/720_1 /TAXON_ID=1082188 /ORGANISM="Strombidium rassoulzadegani, Strain ras09" /LENGTH=110 /DNA_ID=CAMNT_0008648609 /DNA_START=8 /DNA_END=340 /DNA_ORIENTATION=-